MNQERDKIAALAAARSAGHKGGGSESFYGDAVVLANAGIAGERAFARAFGLPYDDKDATGRPEGDGGVDFVIQLVGRRLPLRIDIKTATASPWSLLVNVRSFRHPPDIYVGAADINGRVVFMGWLWANEMASKPLKYFNKGPGSECRQCVIAQLRPMRTLCNMFANRADFKNVNPL